MKKGYVVFLLVFMMALPFVTGALAEENTETRKDIVDTAVEAGNFKTLAAALEKADLVDALKGDGPYTVFAPTDEAFEKLLKELNITPEELLARKDLKDILQYHVVADKVMAKDLKDKMKVKTLSKKKLTITLDPVRVNNANVVKADVETSNGVIHVIDTVLIP
ncbi:fasciclin domain-containing protein [Evansella cellulosilytica]|uniref:Beta-Ig-H3/fasciclin n=1 Tax=Evansella cellulosilytica (strain ATCC 21833 / DSM 2522 / FERM P-1141 / JCM 9156 / N-4) TaxID=649639 RepID=E6TVJ3_EVAC2|nr:fasciclin domain-containing protein [Evansella cellulosilytica]ADU31010.1 beta-Ig-H3/fasciclin [Evansella cellulosilytica DSM 2522]